MRTFLYKAYRSKRNRKLHRQIDVAAAVWNHCIALHRRYYRVYGRHLNKYALMKHLTRLKARPKYAFWKALGSQAIQDVVQRIDKGYQLFFLYAKAKTGSVHPGRKVRPPSFRKREKYTSFTLKQAGYRFSGNAVVIGRQRYRFFKSREIEGRIKTLTVKRDSLGEIYFVVVTDGEHQTGHAATTAIAGMDFGLKDFLTISDGNRVAAPEPPKQSLKALAKANQGLARKQKGSHHRRAARKALARIYRRIANQRKDFQFKTALELARRYGAIAVEDLNLAGMKALWGRKVSDLGFAAFISILEHQARKTGCAVVKIDRWLPSSKACSACGEVNLALSLRDRLWTCTSCGATHDRDLNAAINIQRAGASALGLGGVRPGAILASAA